MLASLVGSPIWSRISHNNKCIRTPLHKQLPFCTKLDTRSNTQNVFATTRWLSVKSSRLKKLKGKKRNQDIQADLDTKSNKSIHTQLGHLNLEVLLEATDFSYSSLLEKADRKEDREPKTKPTQKRRKSKKRSKIRTEDEEEIADEDLDEISILTEVRPPVMKVTEEPADAEMRYAELTKNIHSAFGALHPHPNETRKREKLFMRLKEIVSSKFPGTQLEVFGSSASGFAFKNADMDLVLLAPGKHTDRHYLFKLADLLEEERMRKIVPLVHARVPIVKFFDPQSKVSCDLCINKPLGIASTMLLKSYADIDERFQQLGYIVKLWSKQRSINESYRGTLNSFGYLLFLVHFLQRRNPPILPRLQQMKDAVSHMEDDQSYFYDQVETLANFGKENKESMGELLIKFFGFYANEFDWKKQVISIRTGEFLEKSKKRWAYQDGHQSDLLALENPLEPSHNVAKNINYPLLTELKYEFVRGHSLLTRSKISPPGTPASKSLLSVLLGSSPPI